MTNALKKSLLQQLDQAEQAYNRELENGSPDTEQYRQQVAEIKRNLDSLDADESARQEATEAEVESKMQEQAVRESEETATAMEAELRELARIDLPKVHLPLAIFMNIQRSGHALQEAREGEAAAKARVDRLESRKAEIETARQAITNNRMAGNGDDERDGQRLSLCDNDLNGLAPMIDEARQNLQAAQATAQRAQQIFDQSQSQSSEAIKAEDQRASQALTEQVEALLLLLSNRSIVRNGMSVSGWLPSSELRQLVGRF